MKYYRLEISDILSLDKAWEALSSAGFALLYSEESPASKDSHGLKCLYGYLPNGLTAEKVLVEFPAIHSISEIVFDQIDWHAQWGSTGEMIDFDLTDYSPNNPQNIVMSPGPGFGDLTHPTTRLALRLVAKHVQGKYLIDLGCGSGVLSLAAVKLGALGACGIDIDAEAVKHAHLNAKLNGLENHCRFQLPYEDLNLPKGAALVLAMNMISSEQEQAWSATPALHSLPMLSITSGILKSQEDKYVADWQARGWELLDRVYEEKWCGFLFLTPYT